MMDRTSIAKEEIYNSYIRSEKVSVGERLPSLRKLAKKLHVSVPTVSKAIEILATERKVIKRKGSGIYVAAECFDVSNLNPRKIGFIVHSMDVNEILGFKVLHGIESVVREKGFALEVANSCYDYRKEGKCIHEMVARGVAGIILYPVAKRDENEKYIAEALGNTPVVIVDLFTKKMNKSRVVFDNYSASYEMAQSLIAEGRKELLFVVYDSKYHHHSIDDRVRGYKKALADSNISFVDGKSIFETKICLFESGSDFTEIFSYIDSLIAKGQLPDAIMCPTDFYAYHVITHIISRGFDVPNDICVTGFDNDFYDVFIPNSESIVAKWPTTNPDFNRMGMVAAEILIDEIENGRNCVLEKVLPCPILLSQKNGSTVLNNKWLKLENS